MPASNRGVDQGQGPDPGHGSVMEEINTKDISGGWHGNWVGYMCHCAVWGGNERACEIFERGVLILLSGPKVAREIGTGDRMTGAAAGILEGTGRRGSAAGTLQGISQGGSVIGHTPERVDRKGLR